MDFLFCEPRPLSAWCCRRGGVAGACAPCLEYRGCCGTFSARFILLTGLDLLPEIIFFPFFIPSQTPFPKPFTAPKRPLPNVPATTAPGTVTFLLTLQLPLLSFTIFLACFSYCAPSFIPSLTAPLRPYPTAPVANAAVPNAAPATPNPTPAAVVASPIGTDAMAPTPIAPRTAPFLEPRTN